MVLPAHELVVEWVLFSGDKVASPVCVDAESQKVFFAQRREEFEPVRGVCELGDVSLGDSQLLKDFVLGQGWPFCVLWSSFFLRCSWLVRACLALSNLTLETDGSRGDWHACAVECEWEEGTLANLTLIARHEFSLAHGVGVACNDINQIRSLTRQNET